jgi:release factor glutamine methyltransferase
MDRAALVDHLTSAGFIAAAEEADELIEAADGDEGRLARDLARRLTGEPLAWIVGHVEFAGVRVLLERGVYVPRWQTEALARRALELLPSDGCALDICCGSGAIAKVLACARPHARIVGTDIDKTSVDCARLNGVEAYLGDLFAPVPAGLEGKVDLVAGVVPYVPTGALSNLQRDTFRFESSQSYDGGRDGVSVLRRMLDGGTRFLRKGGSILLELGADQAGHLAADIDRLGYLDTQLLVDEEGDVRGLEAVFAG